MGRIPNDDRADPVNPDGSARGTPMGNRTGKPGGIGRHGRGARADPAELSRLLGASARGPRRFTAVPIPIDMGTGGAVCANGHALEGAVLEGEEFGESCPECGAGVLTACPRCGRHFDMGERRADVGPACARCGEALPWSAEARRARRAAVLRVLGAVAAGATIIAGTLYASTFLR